MIAMVKRCPFCNSHNLTMDLTEATSAVRCLDCQAMGPQSFRNDERAVRLWNDGDDNPDALVADRASNRDNLKEVDL